jgi:formylmethanofuran dehydrogenase subunit D
MALVRTEFGEAPFQATAGKVPLGMIFIPYGPPTCRLMGGNTDGTGMPMSKGWEVDVIPLEGEQPFGLSPDFDGEPLR